jgi:hypothetical protein
VSRLLSEDTTDDAIKTKSLLNAFLHLLKLTQTLYS